MELIVYSSSIGIDVHQKMLVCCHLSQEKDGTVHREMAEFRTFKNDLKKFASWCASRHPQVVLMESTGIYWKSPYTYLEEANMVPAVVNARLVKNMEGRKTDVADAEWLAHIGRLGTFCRSYIPSKAYRDLRCLSRMILSMTQDLQRHKNRVSKILTDGGARLNVVFSDVFGVNGRTAVQGLINGKSPDEIIEDLNLRILKASEEDIRAALDCDLSRPHLSTLDALLKTIDFEQTQIEESRTQLMELMPEDGRRMLQVLQTIPGIREISAMELTIELGGDGLSSFEKAEKLASWVGLCPGNNISAGKSKHGHTRQGNRYLRRILCEIAHAAAKTKDCTLATKFKDMRARKGTARAIVALACKIIKIIFTLFKKGEYYRDPHIDYEKMRLNKHPQRYIRYVLQLDDFDATIVNNKTGAVIESKH